MTRDTLILGVEEYVALQKLLDDFTYRANTYSSMFSTLSGQLLVSSGFKTPFNLLAISALLAGIFQSTRELARLIGEKNFLTFFQEGDSWNIYYTLVGEDFLLTTFFDDRTILGIVEVQAKKLSKRILEILRR
ncbi:MAG: hypothetical protein ABDH49_01815 [Candidatus Hydrothermales bacterium]